MTNTRKRNVTWQQGTVNLDNHASLKGHRGAVIWLTGLSGSGKSTVASELEKRLFRHHIHTFILDGDNLRHGLNRDLGFSQTDRKENVRRLGEVAKLFVDAGLVVIVAAISPFRIDREQARTLLPADRFFEVFLSCPLKVCEQRDSKGLYKKARAAEITDFTGISSPYEEPRDPEIIVKTDELSIDETVDTIWKKVMLRGFAAEG
ncbi:adenylyl-sulfate kinase [Paenibacillus endophyticus]|uniref:Adenylyl-sulfate kinase n=1 Tax=Paenibacillus endophyticus TaxID=1294268 RepID=A0A7W5G9X9_9BACL|nr:adenylyl-sulfate kinase [Paenibacillus endophyticus]